MTGTVLSGLRRLPLAYGPVTRQIRLIGFFCFVHARCRDYSVRRAGNDLVPSGHPYPLGHGTSRCPPSFAPVGGRCTVFSDIIRPGAATLSVSRSCVVLHASSGATSIANTIRDEREPKEHVPICGKHLLWGWPQDNQGTFFVPAALARRWPGRFQHTTTCFPGMVPRAPWTARPSPQLAAEYRNKRARFSPLLSVAS